MNTFPLMTLGNVRLFHNKIRQRRTLNLLLNSFIDFLLKVSQNDALTLNTGHSGTFNKCA